MVEKDKNSVSDEEREDLDYTLVEFSTLALEYEEDRKIMKIALLVALVFHAILFVIKFPEFRAKVGAKKADKKVFVVQQVRFKPPPPPQKKKKPPLVKKKKIPLPDPTPDEPEPIRIEEEEPEIEIPEEDVVFDVPEAPPSEPTGPINVTAEVTPPEKISGPDPRYTEIARKAGVEGVVILRVIINKQGTVESVKLLKKLGFGLDEEAVRAVKQWKFKPALLNGKPVAVYYNLTVHFRLQ